jgi:hypothetical protein
VAPGFAPFLMKTSYELAMQRLSQSSPSPRLSDEKKKALADLDSRYKAKIAEREIALGAELATAGEKGDFEAMEKARQRLADERRKLQAELEEKKEQVRQESKPSGSR